MVRLVVVSALVTLLAACAGGAPEGPDLDAVTAPTSVTLGGETFTLSTYAWQDQMPSVGDEPGPCASLCVNGAVESESGEPLPRGIEVVDVVAVVDGEQQPFEEQELRGLIGPSAYEFVVRGGPALVPGTSFDLAVLVSLDGEEAWVRAEGVTVERTA